MAVEIPKINDIFNDILNDIATEFGVDVNELGTTYRVQAKVEAAIIYIGYLALSSVQKNIFYDLAEESVLIRYGTAILGRKPAPAEAGEYLIEVTGQIGATIPAGTQFVASDTTLAAGFLFIVDTDFILSATTDYLPIRSLDPGTSSALIVNDLVESTSPIANVNSEAIVSSITKQATASETISSYRADVVQAARIEPQGGSPGDFRLWCLEIPEIRTVYPFAKIGAPGEIEIYVEATPENTQPAQITGVPTQQTLDDVYTPANALDPETGIVVINPITANGRRPIGVFAIYSLPVLPVPIDINFTNLSDESVSNSIRSGIDNLLYNIRPFVAGADIIENKNDVLSIGIMISEIIQLLSGTGITFTNVTFDVDGITENEHRFLLGYYPYLRFINNDGNPI